MISSTPPLLTSHTHLIVPQVSLKTWDLKSFTCRDALWITWSGSHETLTKVHNGLSRLRRKPSIGSVLTLTTPLNCRNYKESSDITWSADSHTYQKKMFTPISFRVRKPCLQFCHLRIDMIFRDSGCVSKQLLKIILCYCSWPYRYNRSVNFYNF